MPGKVPCSLIRAVSFHFASLAHDNSASSSEVLQVFSIPGTTPAALNQPTVGSNTPTPTPLLLVGEQRIQKFGKETEAEDRVRIYLALWRLTPAKDVDLIMSLNESLSLQAADAGASPAKDTFLLAARTLRIRDWTLFA